MIRVEIYRLPGRGVRGFRVANHGAPIVCAAVSALVLNAVNSIKSLTDEAFSLDYEEEGGYIHVRFTAPPLGEEAALLVRSLMLGLEAVAQEYPEDIGIEYIDGGGSAQR